jgi:class 3 adenylate cyclase
MEKYYKERFEAQRRLARNMASSLEVNEILEKMRGEIRALIPKAMEACILLLDSEARKYTRPLQCALYDRPVNCLSCKRNRAAVQKAISRKKAVVVNKSDPIVRHDGSLIEIGPEVAIPVHGDNGPIAVVSVVSRPGARFSRKDFYFLKDISESVGHVILNAKRHWEVTQEKIRISQILGQMSPFVPLSVRNLVKKPPGIKNLQKEKKDVTVLFLDMEDYTKLSSRRTETEVNDMVEKLFSNFVDPIHRSHGEIVETAGDGLLIVFQNHDAKDNAINAIKAAFDIYERTQEMSRTMGDGFGPVKINMGINSGTALVGMTRFKGSLDTRMTYTATGPVTNLAARLASHAQGGDILIGICTKGLIEGLWRVYPRDPAIFKGIERPVKIYSLFR